MHDLNTINKINAESFAAGIQNLRKQGRWVVATYEGLTLTGIESFSDGEIAETEAATAIGATGQRKVVFSPLNPAAQSAPTRDQSEDREQPYSLEQLAALGNSSVANPAVV